MGKIKYLKHIKEFIGKKPVVSINEIKTITHFLTQRFELNEEYIYLLLHNLIKKGELRKIARGWYSKYDDPMYSVLCFKPSYLGLEQALSIHNLWEQESNVVVITSKKIRPGVRKVLDSNIIIHRIETRYLFGVEFIKYGEFYLPVSDIEKTLIDLIYFKRKLDKDIIKEFKKRVDGAKLNDYLKRYPSRIGKQVLGVVE